jgi:hypothetical protein
MHFRRWERNGDPNVTRRTPDGEPLRFLFSTAVHHEGDDCLIWPYNKTDCGYPHVRFGGKPTRGHRILCEAAHGPQPSDLQREVAHKCGNRACVNPRHLRWASRDENEADKIQHGTTNRGERQGSAKLTAADVLKIRDLEGKLSRREIAELFGVVRPTIDKIHGRQRWSWL